jgi:hypothetical protein
MRPSARLIPERRSRKVLEYWLRVPFDCDWSIVEPGLLSFEVTHHFLD